MKFFPISLALAFALLLPACLPESKNPLSSPSASRIDTRLNGVYAPRDSSTDKKQKQEESGCWVFHYRGATVAKNAKSPRTTPWLEILAIEPRDDDGLKTDRYEALATTIAGHDYLSFIEIHDNQSGKKGTQSPFSFARYEVNWRGDLRIWIADDKAWAAAIKSGKIRGTVIHGKYTDTVKITDTTERLAAFIGASDPKTLFTGTPMVLRKIGK